jgi:acyl carrier protein
MNTLDTLNEVFRTVFDLPDLHISLEMTAHDVEGWDSLSHVNLILAVEFRFSIQFTAKELLTMSNIGDLHQAIEKKLPR